MQPTQSWGPPPSWEVYESFVKKSPPSPEILRSQEWWARPGGQPLEEGMQPWAAPPMEAGNADPIPSNFPSDLVRTVGAIQSGEDVKIVLPHAPQTTPPFTLSIYSVHPK